jgi:hypothetical protein
LGREGCRAAEGPRHDKAPPAPPPPPVGSKGGIRAAPSFTIHVYQQPAPPPHSPSSSTRPELQHPQPDVHLFFIYVFTVDPSPKFTDAILPPFSHLQELFNGTRVDERADLYSLGEYGGGWVGGRVGEPADPPHGFELHRIANPSGHSPLQLAVVPATTAACICAVLRFLLLLLLLLLQEHAVLKSLFICQT